MTYPHHFPTLLSIFPHGVDNESAHVLSLSPLLFHSNHTHPRKTNYCHYNALQYIVILPVHPSVKHTYLERLMSDLHYHVKGYSSPRLCTLFYSLQQKCGKDLKLDFGSLSSPFQSNLKQYESFNNGASFLNLQAMNSLSHACQNSQQEWHSLLSLDARHTICWACVLSTAGTKPTHKQCALSPLCRTILSSAAAATTDRERTEHAWVLNLAECLFLQCAQCMACSDRPYIWGSRCFNSLLSKE